MCHRNRPQNPRCKHAKLGSKVHASTQDSSEMAVSEPVYSATVPISEELPYLAGTIRVHACLGRTHPIVIESRGASDTNLGRVRESVANILLDQSGSSSVRPSVRQRAFDTLFTLDKLDVMSHAKDNQQSDTHGSFTGCGLPSSSFITT